MTIRKSSHIFYLITGALILLLIMFVTLRFFEQRELRLAQQARHSSFLAADELRQSSDDLTRMARTYVITGDPKFERMYWEILAIRNGETARPRHYERSYWDLAIVDSDIRSEHEDMPVALRARLQQLGITPAELTKLEEAETKSNQLVELERLSFNAMKGLFKNSTGQFDIRGTPDAELARHALHGEEYHKAKASIMASINEFHELLDARTQTAIATAERRTNLYVAGVFATLGLLLLWLGLSYFIVRRKVESLEILERDTQNMSRGSYSSQFNIDARDEIGQLSRTLVTAGLERDRYNNELEARVAARTSELEHARQAMLGKGLILGDSSQDLPVIIGKTTVTPVAVRVPVDLRILEKLVGNNPVVINECLRSFRASATTTAAELNAAYHAGQSAALEAVAHKLKSSARSVSALALGELCAGMEEACASKQTTELATLFPPFMDEMVALDVYFKAL